MLFPKSRIKFTTTYQGKSDPDGWIILELTGSDVDGVNKLYISMSDLEQLKAKGDVTTDRLKQARALFGSSDDEEEA